MLMTDHISHTLHHLKCHGDPKLSQSHRLVINDHPINDFVHVQLTDGMFWAPC